MRHPVRADVLCMVNLQQVSQHSGVHYFFHAPEIGMEAHFKADSHLYTAVQGRFQKGHILFKSLCNGLFQKHVIAVAHGFQGHRDVQFVRSGNNDGPDVTGPGKEFLNGGKAVLRRNPARFCGGR